MQHFLLVQVEQSPRGTYHYVWQFISTSQLPDVVLH